MARNLFLLQVHCRVIPVAISHPMGGMIPSIRERPFGGVGIAQAGVGFNLFPITALE